MVRRIVLFGYTSYFVPGPSRLIEEVHHEVWAAEPMDLRCVKEDPHLSDLSVAVFDLHTRCTPDS